MQEVHTFRRLGVPDTSARTVWMFGFQRRRVRTCECDTLLPKPGPLPQTSQTEATAASKVELGEVCQRLCWSGQNNQPVSGGSLRSIPEAAAPVRTVRLSPGGCPPFPRDCLSWGDTPSPSTGF